MSKLETTTFFLPSGRNIIIGRVPQIGDATRTDYQQDVLSTDSGKVNVKCRKIRVQEFEVEFNDLSKKDQVELDLLYKLVEETKGTFRMQTQPITSELWQVGMTAGGSPIVAGGLVQADFDDDGVPLEVGRLYRRMDGVTYDGLRIRRGTFRARSRARNGVTYTMTLFQELDGP